MHSGKKQETLQLHLCIMRKEEQVLRMSALSQEERRTACVFLW